MYLASGQYNTELRMFRGLINQYLSGNKNRETKKMLDEVIKSIHLLLLDEIKGYEVDNSIFSIVIPFYKFIENETYNRQYFEELNIEKINENDYETLNGILSSLVHLNELEETL